MQLSNVGSWFQIRISKRNLDELVKTWDDYEKGEGLPVLVKVGPDWTLTLVVEPDEIHYKNVP